MIERLRLRIYCLHTRCAIHMSHSRNLFSHFVSHIEGACHKRRLTTFFKESTCIFEKHRRCKWTKSFSKFHNCIHALFHVGEARVCKNRTMSKRTSSIFHSPLIPPNDQSLFDHFCCANGWIGNFFKWRPYFFESFLKLIFRIRRTPSCRLEFRYCM